MSRILLNKDGTMDTVTLILQTKAFETLNTIRGAKRTNIQGKLQCCQ